MTGPCQGDQDRALMRIGIKLSTWLGILHKENPEAALRLLRELVKHEASLYELADDLDIIAPGSVATLGTRPDELASVVRSLADEVARRWSDHMGAT